MKQAVKLQDSQSAMVHPAIAHKSATADSLESRQHLSSAPGQRLKLDPVPRRQTVSSSLSSAIESLACAAIALAEDKAARMEAASWMKAFDYHAYMKEIEHLTDTEAGCYLKLLIASWCYRYLPNDLSAIRIFAGLSTTECEVAMTPLRAFFDLTPEGYIRHRTEAEREA